MENQRDVVGPAGSALEVYSNGFESTGEQS